MGGVAIAATNNRSSVFDFFSVSIGAPESPGYKHRREKELEFGREQLKFGIQTTKKVHLNMLKFVPDR